VISPQSSGVSTGATSTRIKSILRGHRMASLALCLTNTRTPAIRIRLNGYRLFGLSSAPCTQIRKHCQKKILILCEFARLPYSLHPITTLNRILIFMHMTYPCQSMQLLNDIKIKRTNRQPYDTFIRCDVNTTLALKEACYPC
jgi:hypothetical protein